MQINVIACNNGKPDGTQRIPRPRYTDIGTVLLPASSRYIGINFPALHRNWFSQLNFHFSHQSITRLSTITSVVHSLPILQFHEKSTKAFELSC